MLRIGLVTSHQTQDIQLGLCLGAQKKNVSTLRGFESARYITLKVGFKSWLFLPFLLVLLKRDIGQFFGVQISNLRYQKEEGTDFHHF